ncbi:MAG: alpha/beta fold hydrolase [Gemmatimonadota bacterium]
MKPLATTATTLVTVLVSAFAAAVPGPAHAQDRPPASPPADWGPVSINLTEIEYPYPVEYMDLNVYGEDVRIGYMDVAPTGTANGQTVLLLHGGSYYGWYWEEQIEDLAEAGFRVVVKDRLGWGKSSKPVIPMGHSLHAHNSMALLDHLGVDRVAVAGHSIGGQMATRLAYLYPERVTHMVMVNPVGLTDGRMGRGFEPYDPAEVDVTPDLQEAWEGDVRTDMRRYADWRPEYLEHLRIRHGNRLAAGYPRMRHSELMASNMRRLDSVVDDWPHISTKAMLLGGELDGPSFPDDARRAVESLQNAELVLIEGVGHNPHEEAPDIVSRELIRFFSSDPNEPAGDGDYISTTP